MAQIRDARTSTLIAEGTPTEMALAAELVDGDVLFDDVGEGFDPAAVRKAHREEITSLKALAAKAKAGSDARARLESTIAERAEIDERASEIAPRAEIRLDEARQLVDGA